MWVGLSSKKVNDINKAIPLENNTKSGKIIEQIETANDFRKFLIQTMKVLTNDYQSLIDLLNAAKDDNEN